MRTAPTSRRSGRVRGSRCPDPFPSLAAPGLYPDVGPCGLLARRQRARHSVRLGAERLDVAVHRAQIALAHLLRVPPRHGRLSVAFVRRGEHLDPMILALPLHDGAEVLPIRRTPLAT